MLFTGIWRVGWGGSALTILRRRRSLWRLSGGDRSARMHSRRDRGCLGSRPICARAALARQWRESRTSPTRARRTTEQRRSGRPPRWVPRSVAVVIALVACFVAIELAGAGSDTGPSPALAAALGRLAQIAATGPSLVPGPGRYLYVDSENFYPADAIGRGQECVTYAPDHRQVWIAANGSGLLEDTTGQTTFTSPSDRAICTTMHLASQASRGTSKLWFAARCLELGPGNDMQALSTNPRVLLLQMRRLDGRPTGPAEDFVHIGDFLRETDASPAVRAALYQAAALIPGVRLLGIVRDHLGRRGLGVAYDSHGIRHELIFNPHTSALMGEQDIGSVPGANDWAVYLTSRVVDQLPQRSPLRLSPPCVNGGGYSEQTPEGDVQTGAQHPSATPSRGG